MMGRGGRPKGKVNATGNVTLSRNRATSPLAIASELEQQPFLGDEDAKVSRIGPRIGRLGLGSIL